MVSLESKLCPSQTRGPWQRDVFCVLVLLSAGLVLPWWRDGLAATVAWPMDEGISYVLLLSLGFLLALRRGAVDLSVWSAAAVGGLAAAWALNDGRSVVSATAIGIACGAAIGAVNALLVALARVPSPIATGVTGGAVVLMLPRVLAAREVVLSTSAASAVASDGAVLAVNIPRVVCGGAYLLVVAALVYAGPMGLGRRLAWSPRRRLAAALCASSALAACGGVVWLLATHRTPVPHRLVDDLRIPAAAILAGGMYLAGPNRSLLAVALLPMAVVVAALWTEQFAPLEVGGWWFQAAVPAAVAQVAFVAADRGCRPRRSGRLGAVLATWFVMCLLAIGLLGVPGSGGMAAGALRIIAIAQCAAAALIWAGAVRCGLTHIA